MDKNKNDVFESTYQIHRDELRARGRTGDQLNNGEERKKTGKKTSRPFISVLLTNQTTLQSASKSNPLNAQTHIFHSEQVFNETEREKK